MLKYEFILKLTHAQAQSDGAIEYTDECHGYETKQANGEASVMLEYPFIAVVSWEGRDTQ